MNTYVCDGCGSTVRAGEGIVQSLEVEVLIKERDAALALAASARREALEEASNDIWSRLPGTNYTGAFVRDRIRGMLLKPRTAK